MRSFYYTINDFTYGIHVDETSDVIILGMPTGSAELQSPASSNVLVTIPMELFDHIMVDRLRRTQTKNMNDMSDQQFINWVTAGELY